MGTEQFINDPKSQTENGPLPYKKLPFRIIIHFYYFLGPQLQKKPKLKLNVEEKAQSIKKTFALKKSLYLDS